MEIINRITSDNITELSEGEIFVFGSNLSGIHGKGAAKVAIGFGAIYGIGIGIQGSTYAIPTKDRNVRDSLDIEVIKKYVDEFIEYAKLHSDLCFLVTEIGCGLAGYKPSEISVLFKGAIEVSNIHLPLSFWYHLLK